VVRTSVFGGWRTFPDLPNLWLTDDHFVGKLSAMVQPYMDYYSFAIPSGDGK